MKITAIVTCFNEADNMQALMESIKWVDEIMVVDSFSTDETVAIARNYTDFVVQRPYKGPADQKNWAIPQATHPWILLLDADERVTPELKQEIQTLLKAPATIDADAFWIKRKNYFMGQHIRYTGWGRDKVIRLFRRDTCRYNDKQVHEEIETRGKSDYLKHPLVHYTFKNIDHYFAKTQRYAKWSAKDHAHKTPKVTGFHLYFKPFFRFLKHYIWQRGFLDGKIGFIISVLMAFGVFLRYVYIKEMQRKGCKTSIVSHK